MMNIWKRCRWMMIIYYYIITSYCVLKKDKAKKQSHPVTLMVVRPSNERRTSCLMHIYRRKKRARPSYLIPIALPTPGLYFLFSQATLGWSFRRILILIFIARRSYFWNFCAFRKCGARHSNEEGFGPDDAKVPFLVEPADKTVPEHG